MNISNKLTILRMILAFVSLGFILWDSFSSLLIAFIVFILASITDFFDGFFARRHNIVTDLGKILDPIADKILVISVFIGFVELKMVNSWMVVAIVFRELLITRIRVYALNKGVVLEAKFLGKQKTVSQMVGIIIIFTIALFAKKMPDNTVISLLFNNFIPLLMWYIMLITVFSGLHYLWENRKAIKTF